MVTKKKTPEQTETKASATKATGGKKSAKKVVPKPVEKVAMAAKPLEKDFLIGLAAAIREAVLPLVLAVKGRDVVGNAINGDATFHLDKVAEKALLTYLRNAKKPVAYYSEDTGYTTFTSSQPEYLLVVDPIDGSRAAKSGFESCVISMVSTRVIERPVMSDVDNACVMEINGPRTFYAEAGGGVRIYSDGRIKKPKLSPNTDLECLSWSMTVPARPAELIFPTVHKLIDTSSLKGGFFACNSTAFSLTRLITNQLDACVDVANRYLRDIPDSVEDYFINAGRGAILGIAPYDMAGGLLVVKEAGCIVTDAYGKGFDDILLLDNSVSNQHSLIGAANAELHAKLLEYLDKRIRQFEGLLSRRLGRGG
jgi:myo-inositol-1(or 4)-monophosphatase